MNRFALAALAATALVPVSAVAQSSSSSSASSASSAVSHSRSGVSWGHRGGGSMMKGHRMQRHHGMRGGNKRFFVHRGGGNKMMRGGHHGINRHHKYKRIHRGFSVPHSWWAPRYNVWNWNMYGFTQPAQGRRWIRYYDDALLIDQQGRVEDGRWDMDWDRYGDAWGYDQDGIPYYDGEEDDWDGEDRGYAEYSDGPPPPQHCGHGCPPPPHHAIPPVPPVPPMPCAQACAQPGYSYGHGYTYPHGYGYGWMHGGMVTITETTVHAAAPQTITETVYVEKPVRTKRRSYKRAKPRPRPGERG